MTAERLMEILSEYESKVTEEKSKTYAEEIAMEVAAYEEQVRAKYQKHKDAEVEKLTHNIDLLTELVSEAEAEEAAAAIAVATEIAEEQEIDEGLADSELSEKPDNSAV